MDHYNPQTIKTEVFATLPENFCQGGSHPGKRSTYSARQPDEIDGTVRLHAEDAAIGNIRKIQVAVTVERWAFQVTVDVAGLTSGIGGPFTRM